ncbi:MAG: T9SS type A sorting domain-containing protein, partial [Crocinitomicaceae bacterium]|nr:T9SS type A sorting domain-containing protein [Crocinitomicaceae bacterium]
YIDPGTTVDVDIDAFTNYLSIDGQLNMNQELTLSIFSNVEITGNTNFSAGKIAMVGAVDQFFDAPGVPTTFHDLEINNSSGSNVDLFSSTYTLEGSLLMEKGHLIIENTGGGTFTVESTSGTTGGRIGRIKPGCTITGFVRVRRNLPAGNADFRNLASPVIGATLAMWDNSIEISGIGFPDGCAWGPGGCYHSVKEHYQGNYHDVTDINEILNNGQGYEVYVGDDLVSFSGATLEVNGLLNTNSSVVVNVLNDWNILGNPYASPILFSTVQRNHVDNYFYIYDASTGGYQWYDGASNTSSIPELANGRLASGQGFWTYDWGTMTYEQTDKVDEVASFIKSSVSVDEAIYFTVSENNTTYETTISFQEHFACEDDFDTIRDMRHLSVGDEKCPSVAIKTIEDLLRKNWISTDVRDKSFDLFSSFKNEGYYTFKASNLSNFDSYKSIYLFDKQENKFTNLKDKPEYLFYTESGEHDRFKIIMSNVQETTENPFANASMNETENGLSITQMGSYIDISNSSDDIQNVEISLINILGQENVYSDITTLTEGSTIIHLPTNLKGIYIFTMNIQGQRISKKLIF